MTTFDNFKRGIKWTWRTTPFMFLLWPLGVNILYPLLIFTSSHILPVFVFNIIMTIFFNGVFIRMTIKSGQHDKRMEELTSPMNTEEVDRILEALSNTSLLNDHSVFDYAVEPTEEYTVEPIEEDLPDDKF